MNCFEEDNMEDSVNTGTRREVQPIRHFAYAFQNMIMHIVARCQFSIGMNSQGCGWTML